MSEHSNSDRISRNLTFRRFRQDGDSEGSYDDCENSVATVKCKNYSRRNSISPSSDEEQDVEKETSLPAMESSELSSVASFLYKCKFRSPYVLLGVITVTLLALFAATFVSWQVPIHQNDFRVTAAVVEDQAPVVSFPTGFNNLAELARPFSPEIDIPFFWHVPGTAGVMVQNILGRCYGLTQASNLAKGFDEDKILKIRDVQGIKYVNVNTDSLSDIDRARRLDFTNSNLADVVITADLYSASSILTTSRAGRMFTLLRNPIERAQSMYHILTERSEDIRQMTFEEYANSRYIENNWLTRYLLNEMGRITPDHVEMGKEILRRKCLIGLAEEPLESIERFTKYFQWYNDEVHNSQCQTNMIEEVYRFREDHTPPEEGSQVWDMFMRHNQYDMEIYQYARQLFAEQKGMVGVEPL